jgi:hypothetical protein
MSCRALLLEGSEILSQAKYEIVLSKNAERARSSAKSFQNLGYMMEAASSQSEAAASLAAILMLSTLSTPDAEPPQKYSQLIRDIMSNAALAFDHANMSPRDDICGFMGRRIDSIATARASVALVAAMLYANHVKLTPPSGLQGLFDTAVENLSRLAEQNRHADLWLRFIQKTGHEAAISSAHANKPTTPNHYFGNSIVFRVEQDFLFQLFPQKSK